MRKDKFIYTHALKSIVGHETTSPSATCCRLEKKLFHRPESTYTPNMVLTTYHHDLLNSNKPYIQRKRVSNSARKENYHSSFLLAKSLPRGQKITEIYNYQRIQLSNTKFINVILGGTLDLA